MLTPFQLPSFSYGFMPNAETERNGHEGQCAARIGTDCSPPHVWHLATPLNERNNEFFLLKGFTSTYLKETRFSFHAHFSWGPPSRCRKALASRSDARRPPDAGAQRRDYGRRYRVPLPDPILVTRPLLTRSARIRPAVDWETPRPA